MRRSPTACPRICGTFCVSGGRLPRRAMCAGFFCCPFFDGASTARRMKLSPRLQKRPRVRHTPNVPSYSARPRIGIDADFLCPHLLLQKTLSRMICEGVGVTYVSHHRCRVCVPSYLHYLIQTRVMNSCAGNEARSQRMSCYVLRVQSDECGVMLNDSRNIAVVHRPAPQVPAPPHCLEERTLGYA